MRKFSGFCTLAVALTFGVTAYGQNLAWVPVGASASHAIAGNEISFDAGTAVTQMDFEIRVTGWASAAGAPTMGAMQATVDSTGFSGSKAENLANGTVGGVDLVAIVDGTYGGFAGAYIVLTTCQTFPGPVNTGIRCDLTIAPPIPCTGAEVCLGNPEYVFLNIVSTAAVSTAIANYAWGGTTGAVCADEADGRFYAGTLLLSETTASAKGTYTFGFDESNASSFLNDCSAIRIPGLTFTPGQVTFVTGACCRDGGTVCEDNKTAAECAVGGGQHFPGEECATFTCPSCENDMDCTIAEGNGCTDDTCMPDQTCVHVLNYDPATQCCDPADGATVLIDDDDVCTEDTCDSATGIVTNDPTTTAGWPCDDYLGCTHTDVCDGVNSDADGGCIGDDANDDPCTTDADCVVGLCDLGTGFCVCTEDTVLVIEVVDPGNGKDPNCFLAGETVEMVVTMVGSEVVTGGQFLLTYPTWCLGDAVADTCDGSPFQNVIANTVDPDAGTIWFAVTVDPFAPVGTTGPENIVCLTFTKLDVCGECEVCFDSVNPQNLRLTNENGNMVPLDVTECSKPIELAGDIDMVVPEGIEMNVDCDLSVVESYIWDAPYATDTCDGDLDVVCVSDHDGGVANDHLIMGGGMFAQGKHFFRCDAENSCGNTITKVWTVDISDQQTLDIYVQLEPDMVEGLLSRCICFDLYDEACLTDPDTVCEVMWFGGPYNFPGKARDEIKIPKGQWRCITAQDMLHSLRSTAFAEDITCEAGIYYAEFRGDPLLGGNWLVQGNLDAWKGDGSTDTIDILDFGMFMAEIAGLGNAPYTDGNTDCSTPGPHGDINGDGEVDAIDYQFIIDNYLKASKQACCEDVGAAEGRVMYESITAKEARALNTPYFDLNKDGVMDAEDMAYYTSGSRSLRK